MRSNFVAPRASYAVIAASVVAFAFAARASVSHATSSGRVTVHVGNANKKSDSCGASRFSDIFVTIAEIDGHTSGKGVKGWHNLTPDLASNPQQVDLLGSSSGPSQTPFDSSDCMLTTLGSGDTGIPPGKYQNFRMKILSNGASPAPSPNACSSLGAGTYNCIQFSDGSFAPLKVPPGVVKIPTTRIAKGQLTIAPGEGVDLDIDLDACRDIVARGGPTSTYNLRPVVHAGAITLDALIGGDVVVGSDNGSGDVVAAASPVAVPSASVWLESAPQSPNFALGDPTPAASAAVSVEQVVAQTTTDSNGHFVFCPVPSDTYEIVASANSMPSATGTPSDVTITTGVEVPDSPDNLVIPLLASSVTTLNAEFTNAGSGTPSSATMDFGAVQSASGGPLVQIPLLSGSASSPVTTSLTGCTSVPPCPLGTECACFALNVPSDNPVVGTESGSYATPAPSPAFQVFGQTSNQTVKCSPPDLISPAGASPLPTPTLSFVSCM